MNLWLMVITTDFTSDRPKMAQNKVLKLSSTLEEKGKKNKVQSRSVDFGKILHPDVN